MLGFMRRYDPSYAYAKKQIDSGVIGTPYLVKATGLDPEAVAGIHDIDLMRWFLGSEAEEVYALGATFKHPEFRQAGDDETGLAVFRFKNGGMGTIHVGRTCPYGYHVETEIVGTEGTLRISAVPEKNLTRVYGPGGVRAECVASFPERFREAYLLEMQEFVDCVRTGRKPGTTVYDGVRSTAVGYATTEAWRTGRPVKISLP